MRMGASRGGAGRNSLSGRSGAYPGDLDDTSAEHLAKTGAPSRAEITDAAMGERAESVMLNKGPHLAQAVQLPDDILCRIKTHQSKKAHAYTGSICLPFRARNFCAVKANPRLSPGISRN
jgi:hypothetical protein